MKKLTKRLELTLYMADNYVLAEVYEPESDEKIYINAPYSPDEHPEFDEKLCMEIYSWLSLWMDEMEDDIKPEPYRVLTDEEKEVARKALIAD